MPVPGFSQHLYADQNCLEIRGLIRLTAWKTVLLAKKDVDF